MKSRDGTDESALLRRFPSKPLSPQVTKIKDSFIYFHDGSKVLDLTSGYSACVALGGSDHHVRKSIKRQLRDFSYVSALEWSNPSSEYLAQLLVRQAPQGLNRVMFPGCSGSEAIEAAMRMSYQIRVERGQPEKAHFISRSNAYHGITALALSVTSTDVYEFLRPLQPAKSHLIPQHNYFEHATPTETPEEYATRSAAQLESAILRVGPKKVTAFIAETMLGQLQGNVPPSADYWRQVRQICDRYDVHLILDEVYCGLGRSGRVYCCDWDGVVPDFVAQGKQLAAGYGPISAVVTKSAFEEEIKQGSQRILFASTYEAHPLAVAAAIAVQERVQSHTLLKYVEQTGIEVREYLTSELGDHEFFRNVRGRGLLNSIEYDCNNRDEFNERLTIQMRERGFLIQAKYHRCNFNPASNIKHSLLFSALEGFVEEFKSLSLSYEAKTLENSS